MTLPERLKLIYVLPHPTQRLPSRRINTQHHRVLHCRRQHHICQSHLIPDRIPPSGRSHKSLIHIKHTLRNISRPSFRIPTNSLNPLLDPVVRPWLQVNSYERDYVTLERERGRLDQIKVGARLVYRGRFLPNNLKLQVIVL